MKKNIFNEKKKGAALVMMIVVTTLLMVLALTLLTVYSTTFKVENKYDDNESLSLLAESGINLGITKIKNEGTGYSGTVPSFTFNSSRNQTCSVNIGAPVISNNEVTYTIKSTATDNKSTREIVKAYSESNANNPSGPSSLVDNCINLFGGNFNLDNGNNFSLNVKGNLYLQPNNSDTVFSRNVNITDGGVTVVNNYGKINFINNGSDFQSDDSIYLQTPYSVDFSQNIKIKNGDLTIRSGDCVTFDNNGTSNNVNGNVYINSKNGFEMSQDLTVAGGFTVDNSGGDINFSQNSKSVNINKGIMLNNTLGRDILLNKNLTVGTANDTADQGKMNLTALASENMILKNPIDVKNNIYLTADAKSNTSYNYEPTGIYNSTNITAENGFENLESGAGILNDWGSSRNVAGNYYAKAAGDLTFNDNLINNYNGSYTAIAGGNLTYSNNDFSKEVIKSGIIPYKKGINVPNTAPEPKENSVPTYTADSNANGAYYPTMPSNFQKVAASSLSIPQVATSPNYGTFTTDNTNHLSSVVVKDASVQSGDNQVTEALKKDVGSNYKLIIIDGDFDLSYYDASFLSDNGKDSSIDIKNTIIYCTGKFIVDNTNGLSVNFDHSVVYSNGFNLDNSTPVVNMTSIGQPRDATDTFTTVFTDATAQAVDAELRKVIGNQYTDSNSVLNTTPKD